MYIMIKPLDDSILYTSIFSMAFCFFVIFLEWVFSLCFLFFFLATRPLVKITYERLYDGVFTFICDNSLEIS